MAGMQPEEDLINRLKLFTKKKVDGFIDELVDNNVLSRQELQKIEKGMSTIVKETGYLLKDFTKKTQVVGKLLNSQFTNPSNQLSLKFLDEDDSDGSETTSESEDTESLSTASQENKVSPSSYKLKLCSPDRFQKIKEKKANKIYPVMEKEGRTRLALIICNQNFEYQTIRDGSDVDLLGMQDLLENLGYSVVVEKNLTALEMETALRQFAARQEHWSSDSTFLVFMSHGILDGICGTKHSDKEEDVLRDDTIFQIFNNHNCQSLKDKPKVIIMQACRGRGFGFVYVSDAEGAATCGQEQSMQLVRRTTGPIWSDEIMKTHVEKDFIAFKSSTPHNVSWRLETGSLFISQLICYFKRYSWRYHLEAIFKKVQRSFDPPDILTQMPTIERGSMTKYFYLFPGN